MPKYLDHHKVINMPPDVARDIVGKIKTGHVDKFGVKGLNAFIAKNEMWCYAEAPNADAVCKEHEAMGLKLDKGNVIEVQTLV